MPQNDLVLSHSAAAPTCRPLKAGMKQTPPESWTELAIISDSSGEEKKPAEMPHKTVVPVSMDDPSAK